MAKSNETVLGFLPNRYVSHFAYKVLEPPRLGYSPGLL